MKSIFSRISGFFRGVPARLRALWRSFRSLPKKHQLAVAGALAVLLIGGIVLANVLGGSKQEEVTNQRAVTLSTIGSLSGNGESVSIIGSVRSVTEANILSQNGGTVRAVRTSIGASVPAGYVIAELENASERAAVLQAEGSYDAAVAARNAVSPTDASSSVRNAYRTAFSSSEVAVESDVDTFFGEPGVSGPKILINPSSYSREGMALSRARADLDTLLNDWRVTTQTVSTANPETLLNDAESKLRTIATFITNLSAAANATDSDATSAQLGALASARATINGQIAAIASARSSYRSQSVSSTASVDASVKQALGGLRSAQANLERTIVRAPIGGTINFLPIRVGDYVTALTHVATVAQNGSLEIVAYVSEADRDLLSAGTRITVEESYSGIITSIAPALDPVTKQIEIHVAVDGASELVNGQTVRLALPNAPARTETVSGPIVLPLAAVKLSGDKRIVFTVDEEGRLAGNDVEVGAVRGDRIEILTALSPDMRIVTDARGLAAGEKVRIAQ